jgi:hypothetical protein
MRNILFPSLFNFLPREVNEATRDFKAAVRVEDIAPEFAIHVSRAHVEGSVALSVPSASFVAVF